jgi:hypothetical protein
MCIFSPGCFLIFLILHKSLFSKMLKKKNKNSWPRLNINTQKYIADANRTVRNVHSRPFYFVHSHFFGHYNVKKYANHEQIRKTTTMNIYIYSLDLLISKWTETLFMFVRTLMKLKPYKNQCSNKHASYGHIKSVVKCFQSKQTWTRFALSRA